MPFQDNYNENRAAGVEGALVDSQQWNAVSKTVEDAAGIGFAVPVEQGSADRGCTVFVGGDLLGVTQRNVALMPSDGDKYAQYAEASVLDEATIWVRPETAVVAQDAAYWNQSTSKWSNDSVNDTAAPGCKFVTSAEAGELAQLRIRIA